MRILLAQNMYYLPSHGGANKSNRLMLEKLAQRGHECHAVVPLTGRLRTVDPDVMPGYLLSRGAEVLEQTERSLVYRAAGVTVHGVTRGQDLPRTIASVAGQVEPDWALVPSDDPGMIVLSSVQRQVERIGYLVHTLQQLPFGPRSFYPSERATAMIRRVRTLVSVSRAAQAYVQRWADLPSQVIYPDVYSGRPIAQPDPARQRFVTMINPCGYKGLPIFLALADALPEVAFLAVDSWGTTDDDRAALAARKNIVVTSSVDDVDEIYGTTRVLLMPSLWDETFGYSCVEAMLRGIPVLAADVGGLREAALGVAWLLPVTPIAGYPQGAAAALPSPDLPDQDVVPWLIALRALLSHGPAYTGLSGESRSAAQEFVAGLDGDALEHCLLGQVTG
jgi:glycosyltransferase involved in cell wall biosynthesis